MPKGKGKQQIAQEPEEEDAVQETLLRFYSFLSENLQLENDLAKPEKADEPLMVFAEIEGKGFGYLANTKIACGTRILAESPIIRVDIHQYLNDMAKMVQRLNDEDRKEFWRLSDCHSLPGEAKSAHGICQTNAIRLDGEMHGIFIKGSRFNHSCNDNIIRTLKDDKNILVFHAARDILPGEELCISYTNTWQPRADRQRRLQLKFKFECSCDTCALTGDARARSDSLRSEFSDLVEEIQMGHDPLKSADRYLEIIQEEWLGNVDLLRIVYLYGYAIAMAGKAKNLDLARDMIRECCKNWVLAMGSDDDEEYTKFRGFAQKLNGSNDKRERQ